MPPALPRSARCPSRDDRTLPDGRFRYAAHVPFDELVGNRLTEQRLDNAVRRQEHTALIGSRSDYDDAQWLIEPIIPAHRAVTLYAAGKTGKSLPRRRRVERAREQVGGLVGAAPSGVVFTADATESNNLALQGFVAASKENRSRILISAVEHASVTATADWLSDQALAKVDIVPVTSGGAVDLDALEQLLGDDLSLC